MTRNLVLLAIAFGLIGSEKSSALDIREQFSFAICAIATPVPQTVADNGNMYDLYRKLPGQTNYERIINVHYGTGFLYASGKFYYLVTAKHIATNCTDASVVIVADVVGDKQLPKQVSFVELATTNSPSFWMHDPLNDVSVLPIFGSVDFIKKFVAGRAYGPKYVCSAVESPSRDIPLNIIGFPGFEGVSGLFSPLSRVTKAASGLLGTPNLSSSYFYLQDPSIQGYSGSPVIDFDDYPFKGGAFALGGPTNPKCFGVVSATFGDDTGGKMARIVPSFYFVELIRKFESTAKFQDLESDLSKRLH